MWRRLLRVRQHQFHHKSWPTAWASSIKVNPQHEAGQECEPVRSFWNSTTFLILWCTALACCVHRCRSTLGVCADRDTLWDWDALAQQSTHLIAFSLLRSVVILVVVEMIWNGILNPQYHFLYASQQTCPVQMCKSLTQPTLYGLDSIYLSISLRSSQSWCHNMFLGAWSLLLSGAHFSQRGCNICVWHIIWWYVYTQTHFSLELLQTKDL